jgi:hypothetical protein
LNFGHLDLFRISSFGIRAFAHHSSTPKVVVKKLLKTCSFLSISVQFLLKTDKKVQKSANFCSFLPSFLAQKHISPIKSRFLLSTTTPFFKKTLKNPYFPFFYSFLSPYYRSAAPQFLSGNLVDGLIFIRRTVDKDPLARSR